MEINRLDRVKEGTIILVDKPYGWTSFDVVGKIRSLAKRFTGDKSIKVGHAGTLDPLATGLLVVCTGKATKQVMELTAEQKGYVARIKLGETTPSFDMETQVDKTFPIKHINQDLVSKALSELQGPQLQVPPSFSAKYVNGKRAYQLARKGVDPKLDPVPIDLFELKLLDYHSPYITIGIVCSKGTYIRALARDIGTALNSGAHLVELRRTLSGRFSVEQALTIPDIEYFFSHTM